MAVPPQTFNISYFPYRTIIKETEFISHKPAPQATKYEFMSQKLSLQAVNFVKQLVSQLMMKLIKNI